MNGRLIQGQFLADSFLSLFPTETTKSKGNTFLQDQKGPIQSSNIPMDIQIKLPDIFGPARNANTKYKNLFGGDLSMHNNDHSAADLAFSGYLAKRGLSPAEADQVFRASKLYRSKWDELRGAKRYGEMTLEKAFELTTKEMQTSKSQLKLQTAKHYKPIYYPSQIAPRRFIGPKISPGTRLFPEKALSIMVGLGATGKTSLLLTIATHVAVGKDWNGYPLERKKVAMFFCEETKEEIGRKFSAIVDGWSDAEIKDAQANLMTVPLLGEDARLTNIDRGQHSGSGKAEEFIRLLEDHDLRDGLVIFDHLQGFTSGDLNGSETATTISREGNKIVDATGASVVFAAHIAKGNINASELGQGFVSGSLAFENAARQLSGLLNMSDEAAKFYGVEKSDYVNLGMAKNSYGGSTEGLWLKKVFKPKYHTVVLEPVELTKQIPANKLTANERLAKNIADYIAKHPTTTRNKLDTLSGTDGEFGASKSKVRNALNWLIEEGMIETHSITEEDREHHMIPKQVREVLRDIRSKTANKTVNKSSMANILAAFKPASDIC